MRLCILTCMLLVISSQAALLKPPLSPTCPASFITSLASDGNNHVWVGTEDDGLFCLDTSTGYCQSFTQKDGLSDHTFYGIAVDKMERVWCGTLNHGVCVFNGKSWKTYNTAEGPLGSRIFDIQCSPVDGDVWIASSIGIARYRVRADTWNYYTRMNGLPSEQVQSMAFNAQGDVFAGLQCGGIAIARASEFHKSWTLYAAPWYFDKAQNIPYTLTPEGEGLPSNLINAMLVTRNGTVWAATAAGLAWSTSGGRSWRFIRGKNYASRMKGVFSGPPKTWKPPSKEEEDRLLPEDYVTCLAESSDGLLWLGFREQGCASFDPKTLALKEWIRPPDKKKADTLLSDGFVNRLQPLPDGRLLVGGYGSGIRSLEPSRKSKNVAVSLPSRPLNNIPSFPSTASPLSEDQLENVNNYLLGLKKSPLKKGVADYLGEDWETQGDGVGRYGRRWTKLCAMNAPICDYDIIGDITHYRISGLIGPHYTASDALRHWIHWIKTDNPRTFYAPDIGLRRQSEWDDHGEAYPRAFDGPDVWVMVKVPAGPQRLSLYFYNKDGHSGANRCRDYLVEVREYQSTINEKYLFNSGEMMRQGLPFELRSNDLTNVIPRAVLARARVRDFWGGVYKSFLVNGPGIFYVRIARQGSHNAIVSCILVDAIPEPVLDPKNPTDSIIINQGGIVYEAPAIEKLSSTNRIIDTARKLWDSSTDVCAYQKGAYAFGISRIMAYRTAVDYQAPDALISNWRWHLSLWSERERRTFRETMESAWTAHQMRSTCRRSAAFSPYSPNVIPFTLEDCYEMQQNGIDWRQFIPKK